MTGGASAAPAITVPARVHAFSPSDTSPGASARRGASTGIRAGNGRQQPSSRPRVPLTQTATWVFAVMYAINAINYLDRYVVVAIAPTLKAQFGLHDRDIGFLTTGFILVYTLAALPAGILADRVARARVVAFGVGIWSLMSTATAFTSTFSGLFVTRAAVGVGEASYAPAGTALLAAYYPREERARMMSRWQTAQLVGITAAFVLTGLVLAVAGNGAWRIAFLITGLPGFVLAALSWMLKDHPVQVGQPATAPTPETSGSAHAAPPGGAASSRSLVTHLRDWGGHLGAVLRIPTVRVLIIMQALALAIVTPSVTFLPIYLSSAHSPFNLSHMQATLVSGAIIVVGGVAGMLLGGYLADWLADRVPGGRVLTAAVGFGLTIPCYLVMLLTSALWLFVVAAILTVVMMNLSAGPLIAALQDATPARQRGSAVAMMYLLSHLLGDVWAVSLVGALSTALGERANLALLLLGMPVLAAAVGTALVGTRVYAKDLRVRTDSGESDDDEVVFGHA